MTAGPGFAGAFGATNAEQADLNQFWFSPSTIGVFVQEVCSSRGPAALISSPSVYFSLPPAVRARCKVLDFDRRWETDPGFVFYDYKNPEALPASCVAAFNFVLADPPFITADVWESYSRTMRLLLRPGGRILCTTIAENEAMMRELLGLWPVCFRPSIPSLVYQYTAFTNYDSLGLSALNPEIDSLELSALNPEIDSLGLSALNPKIDSLERLSAGGGRAAAAAAAPSPASPEKSREELERAVCSSARAWPLFSWLTAAALRLCGFSVHRFCPPPGPKDLPPSNAAPGVELPGMSAAQRLPQ